MSTNDHAKMSQEDQQTLKEEIDHYLEEKERIRTIVGRIGGVPRAKDKIINVVFLTLVIASFGVAMIVQDPRNLPLEIAILLVSFKLIYVVTQNAKLNHSQFWMLSTIEWRLNELAKNLNKMKVHLEDADNAPESDRKGKRDKTNADFSSQDA